MLWGILTLLAVAKGYMQKNHGFDSAELIWVLTRGANTHLLRTGIRYFSFLPMQPIMVVEWDYH
jgi:hypothetical protein